MSIFTAQIRALFQFGWTKIKFRDKLNYYEAYRRTKTEFWRNVIKEITTVFIEAKLKNIRTSD